MTAAVQPNGLWNSQKTFYKPSEQVAAPDCSKSPLGCTVRNESGTHHNNRLGGHPPDGDEEAGALVIVVTVATDGGGSGRAADCVVVPGVDGVVAAEVANLQVVRPSDQAVSAKDIGRRLHCSSDNVTIV